MRRFAGVALLAAGVLTGCSLLSNLPDTKDGTQQPQAFWWEENPASISYVAGPATASVGQPTTISARVIIGSSSCDRFKSLTATVDAASRSVLLRGTRESKRANEPFPCTADYGAKLATVSLTFQATGSYRVTASSFEPASFDPYETPRASIDILVMP